MKITISPTGKKLPTPFVRGYIGGLRLVTGSDTWKGYHLSSIARFIPKEQQQTWHDLLSPYYSHDSRTPTPLDYTILRVLQANMTDDGETDAVKMQHIARAYTFKIGQGWWEGMAPVSIVRDYGLKRLLTPYILKQLDGNSNNTQYKKHNTLKNASICIYGFVYALQQSSGIECWIQQGPKNITISIVECPFCYQSDNCLIFWGIFTGLLSWMHNRYTVAEFTEIVSLNQQASQSHKIVLDI